MCIHCMLEGVFEFDFELLFFDKLKRNLDLSIFYWYIWVKVIRILTLENLFT